jgi:hypothetical protein
MSQSTAKTLRSLGVVLYEGPSMLDGKPIVAIATGLKRPSDNPKTGRMIQVWILRRHVHPARAVFTGSDRSVCGDCPLRRKTKTANGKGGGCYVDASKAPTAVWKAYKAGRYEPLASENLHPFAGRMVRLGAYGDPAAVPLSVFKPILRVAKGHTGYTHQWRTCTWEWRDFLMASTETRADNVQATIRGYSTFRSARDELDVLPSERRCPASAEAGTKTTCEKCGACRGSGVANRVIIAHGSPATLAQYRKAVG